MYSCVYTWSSWNSASFAERCNTNNVIYLWQTFPPTSFFKKWSSRISLQMEYLWVNILHLISLIKAHVQFTGRRHSKTTTPTLVTGIPCSSTYRKPTHKISQNVPKNMDLLYNKWLIMWRFRGDRNTRMIEEWALEIYFWFLPK